jgi:hypothetical protein
MIIVGTDVLICHVLLILSVQIIEREVLSYGREEQIPVVAGALAADRAVALRLLPKPEVVVGDLVAHVGHLGNRTPAANLIFEIMVSKTRLAEVPVDIGDVVAVADGLVAFNLTGAGAGGVGVLRGGEREVALVVHVPHEGLLEQARAPVTIEGKPHGAIEGRAIRNMPIVTLPVEHAVTKVVPIEVVARDFVRLEVPILPVRPNFRLSHLIGIHHSFLELLKSDANAISIIRVGINHHIIVCTNRTEALEEAPIVVELVPEVSDTLLEIQHACNRLVIAESIVLLFVLLGVEVKVLE